MLKSWSETFFFCFSVKYYFLVLFSLRFLFDFLFIFFVILAPPVDTCILQHGISQRFRPVLSMWLFSDLHALEVELWIHCFCTRPTSVKESGLLFCEPLFCMKVSVAIFFFFFFLERHDISDVGPSYQQPSSLEYGALGTSCVVGYGRLKCVCARLCVCVCVCSEQRLIPITNLWNRTSSQVTITGLYEHHVAFCRVVIPHRLRLGQFLFVFFFSTGDSFWND